MPSLCPLCLCGEIFFCRDQRMTTTTREIAHLAGFEPLRQQLITAARAFSGDSAHLAELLHGLVDDVHRAAAEPLEIFPVCHHSPAAAVHMIRRLRERPPKVIY